MKTFKWLPGLLLSALILPMAAQAADYSFTTAAPQDFYKNGSYEEVYGSQYNYGGKNVVDFQVPELEYGRFSTTQTGVMERTILPGLQAAVATSDGTAGCRAANSRGRKRRNKKGGETAQTEGTAEAERNSGKM